MSVALPKVIIIGSSSGIGREMARLLLREGSIVGLAARRIELLSEIREESPQRAYIKRIDIANTNEARQLLRELIGEMGGVKTIVVCAAVCVYNSDLEWEYEYDTILTDVVGVASMINESYNYFKEIGGGHVVGISSFKAVRGGSKSPAYNASKAFLSNYLEGLRLNSIKHCRNIIISDIRPGFVNTAKSPDINKWLVIPTEIAALQICKAIEKKVPIAYVPMRYFFVSFLMKSVSFGLYRKLCV